MSRITVLNDEKMQVRSAVEAIEAAAAAEGRGELTADEQTNVDALLGRAQELNDEIEKASRVEALLGRAAVANKAVAVNMAPAIDNAGEFFSLWARSKDGDKDAEMRVRATLVTGDSPALLPDPIVGEMFKIVDASRPIFSSFKRGVMPAKGKTFNRLKVAQRVSVTEQAAELDALASQKFLVGFDTVTKQAWGGQLGLSEQDIDWTEPSALQMVIQDFLETYAETIEGYVASWLPSSVSASSAFTATNPGTVTSSLTTAANAIYTAVKRAPDTLWLSLDEALELAANLNTDSTKSAIEIAKAAMAEVGIPLNVVVGPQFAANTRILGVASLVESYEQTKGFLEAVNVGTRSRDISYMGYTANFIRSTGFRKLV